MSSSWPGRAICQDAPTPASSRTRAEAFHRFAPIIAAALTIGVAATDLRAHPYDEWAITHYGSPLHPAAQPWIDTDFDGECGLAEFLGLSDPNDPASRPPRSHFRFQTETEPRFGIRYLRRSAAIPSFYQHKPQASADLNAWQPSGGPLGLCDYPDPIQLPSVPGGEWRIASVPASTTSWLRLDMISLSAAWQETLARRQTILDAAAAFGIATNTAGSAPLPPWPCVREFLPEHSPLRSLGPIDWFGRPFAMSTVQAYPVVDPATVTEVGMANAPAEHHYTWESLARLLAREYEFLNAAVSQYAIENNQAGSAPVGWAQIQWYLSYNIRLFESLGFDPLQNVYVIGPTIDDGVRFNPITLARLDAAGWLEDGVPRINRSPDESSRQLTKDLLWLRAALDRLVLEQGLPPGAAVALADLLPTFPSWSPLRMRNGTDILGNPYTVGPLVSDEIEFAPATLAALDGTEHGDRIAAENLAATLGKDLRDIASAASAHIPLPRDASDLTIPISWAILSPSIDPASPVLVRAGLDPLGNPYRIGPTLSEFIGLHPDTFVVLRLAGVLDHQSFEREPIGRDPRDGLMNEWRCLNSAMDQHVIESNLPDSALVPWGLAAFYIDPRSDLFLRGGLDIFGNPFDLRTNEIGPRFNAASIDEINDMLGGWALGNLCVAAYSVAADLARIRLILDEYQAAFALPATHPITWADLNPWINDRCIDPTRPYGDYGFDSLGNRPLIGPTLADPVLIHPATEAAITGAGIAIP